ncbi:MAG: YcgL domain-containing protein [Pseudomonadota bacterium]
MSAHSAAPMRVQVYRSPRVEGMYLLVPAAEPSSAEAEAEDLAVVPAALLERFGEPEASFAFELTADRALSRANPADVYAAFAEQGFYLQMPPPEFDA